MLLTTNKWIIRPNVHNLCLFYKQKWPYSGFKPALVKKYAQRWWIWFGKENRNFCLYNL